MALNSLHQSAQESSDRSNRGSATAFKPFEETIICPGCNRPLPLYLQPVHLEQPLNCPRCSRNLTAMVRRIIKEHRELGEAL